MSFELITAEGRCQVSGTAEYRTRNIEYRSVDRSHMSSFSDVE